MLIVDIALSDIPQDARTTGTNGKIYAKIVVDERKEADKYGNTHSVYMNQTKEAREAKTPKVYVGSAKEIKFNGGANTQQQSNSVDDLGF